MSLRRRPAATPLADLSRRNSTLSDTVSEARSSIRSSTDDLFLPRVAQGAETGLRDDESESHWQSAPLALALVPAVAGVFFHNGSAVLTDVTLLVLAAVFLNWSVRLPWDWYRSAQAVRQHDAKYYDAAEVPEPSEDPSDHDERRQSAAVTASKELQVHELIALASCFVLPLIGTGLLHAIRAKLSRPSEGLVSNYNLTIFLLAAEIRPFAHLLKLVQARTLHLQRIVASSSPPSTEEVQINAGKIAELTARLDELETHVANKATAATRPSDEQPGQPDQLASLVAQATAHVRKDIQPDIDALNRAVRRYEKRSALTSFQTDSRLRDLDAQIHDAHALAAATASAQQSESHRRRRGLASILLSCAYAVLLLPAHTFMSFLSLPSQVATFARQLLNPTSRLGQGRERSGKGKAARSPPGYRSSRQPARNPQRSSFDMPRGLKKPIPEHEE